MKEHLYIDCDAEPEIQNWTWKERPVEHIRCGMIQPRQVRALSVFEEGEGFLDEEFVIRAQKLNSMNVCAFEFYAKRENWEYLPTDASTLVFPKTLFFQSPFCRYVRILHRNGSIWCPDYRWVESGFYPEEQVAVIAESR